MDSKLPHPQSSGFSPLRQGDLVEDPAIKPPPLPSLPPPLPPGDPFHPVSGPVDLPRDDGGEGVGQGNLISTLFRGLVVVFLLTAALTGGWYLVTKPQIGEIRREAYNSGDFKDYWDWCFWCSNSLPSGTHCGRVDSDIYAITRRKKPNELGHCGGPNFGPDGSCSACSGRDADADYKNFAGMNCARMQKDQFYNEAGATSVSKESFNEFGCDDCVDITESRFDGNDVVVTARGYSVFPRIFKVPCEGISDPYGNGCAQIDLAGSALLFKFDLSGPVTRSSGDAGVVSSCWLDSASGTIQKWAIFGHDPRSKKIICEATYRFENVGLVEGLVVSAVVKNPVADLDGNGNPRLDFWPDTVNPACTELMNFKLRAECTPPLPQEYGHLSYDLWLGNIELSGKPFDRAVFQLCVAPEGDADHGNLYQNFFGSQANWIGADGDADGLPDWACYWLVGFTENPTGVRTFDATKPIGGNGAWAKTIDEMASWVEANLSETVRFNVKATLSLGGVFTDQVYGPDLDIRPLACGLLAAQCVDLVVQVPDGAGGWKDGDLSKALPGDKVRFVARGSSTGGAFTQGAFFINGVLHLDDVLQFDPTHFAVEHTLPAGQVNVEAVLLHDSLGWVD